MNETPPADPLLENMRLRKELADVAADRITADAAVRIASRRLHRLEAMMETVPIGVVMADVSGKIIHGNSQVENMLRHPVIYSADVDSYGEWIAFHDDGKKVESHEFPLSRVLRDGEERSEIDVEYQRGDGTRFWMRIIGEPVRNADGDRIGATVALIDIDNERRLQASQKILIAELNHRVKNAFSVVKSIVSQSLRKVGIQHGLRETIDRRLDAYANAHAKLIGASWEQASIMDVAIDILTPIAENRIQIQGPHVVLPSRQALAFSMAFYELATNAVKYGALSILSGTIELSWNLIAGEGRSILEMTWTERHGPAAVTPENTGFGSFITGRALQMETGGEVRRNYDASGYSWHLIMPLNG